MSKKVRAMVRRSLFFMSLFCVILLTHRADASDAGRQQVVKQEAQDRYVFLYADEEMNYFMDRESSKKIRHPYLDESLLDVWVKIAENEHAAYAYPERYGMVHYYVRLNKPELQLIETVLVQGKTAQESKPPRPYREKNWKTVVPDTMEEELYRAIVDVYKDG